jgi:hypothetical protein
MDMPSSSGDTEYDLLYNSVAKANMPTLLKKTHFIFSMYSVRVLSPIIPSKKNVGSSF